MNISERKLDRRAFLGAAGTVGVGAAALALVGCGDDESPQSTTPRVDGTPLATRTPNLTPTKETVVNRQPLFIANVVERPDPSSDAFKRMGVQIGVENTTSNMFTGKEIEKQASLLRGSSVTTSEGYSYNSDEVRYPILRTYERGVAFLPPKFRAKAFQYNFSDAYQNGVEPEPLLYLQVKVARNTSGYKLITSGMPATVLPTPGIPDQTKYPTDLPDSTFIEIEGASLTIPQPKNNDSKGILVTLGSLSDVTTEIMNLFQSLSGQGKGTDKYKVYKTKFTAQNQSNGYSASFGSSEQDSVRMTYVLGKKGDGIEFLDFMLTNNSFVVGNDGVIYSSFHFSSQIPLIFLFKSPNDNNNTNYYKTLDPGTTKSFELGIALPKDLKEAKLVLPNLSGAIINLHLNR